MTKDPNPNVEITETPTTFISPKISYTLVFRPSFEIEFNVPHRPPNKFHRLMQKIFFGFKYKIHDND